MEEVDFKEYFYYDESSPSGLRWKKPVYYGRKRNIVKREIGDVVGSLDKENYWIVKFKQKCYKVHRIIYVITFGDISKTDRIDHIDGNPSNNILSNLRLVSDKLNSRNRKIQSNNKSGVVGVRFCDRTFSYTAQYVGVDGKTVRKRFSCKVLGKELAFIQACEFRKQAMISLNLQGEGYSSRHLETNLK